MDASQNHNFVSGLQPDGSYGSVVGIATMLGSGQCGVRIPVVARGFSLVKCPDWCKGPPSIHFSGCQGYFPFIKWLGYEDNHTPPSIAEVKNE